MTAGTVPGRARVSSEPRFDRGSACIFERLLRGKVAMARCDLAVGRRRLCDQRAPRARLALQQADEGADAVTSLFGGQRRQPARRIGVNHCMARPTTALQSRRS